MLPISIFSTNDFIIGAWDWRAGEYYPGHMQEGIDRLTDAHYNTTCVSYDENFWDMNNTQAKYEASLDALRSHNLDAIFNDFLLNPYWRNNTTEHIADFGKVSLYNLTNSNYLRLEAEYNDESNLNNDDSNNDAFFYRFTRDAPTSNVLTRPIPESNASNGWAYQYDPSSYPSDDWVTILDKLCCRWDVTDTKINNDLFQFSKICAYTTPGEYLLDNAYLNNDSLYISISVNWNGFREMSDNLIRMVFYDTATDTEIPSYLFVPLGTYALTLNTNDYEDGAHDYNANNQENGYRVFTYAISLANLRAYGFFGADPITYSYRNLENFGVKVQWSQIARVSVDYLEFEDSTHRYMRQHNDQVKGWLQEYLNTRLIGLNNPPIAYYTGVDEPYISNFDSFRIVGNWLRELNLPPIASPDNDTRFYVSTLTKPNTEHVNLMRIFDTLANTSVMFVDHYPIRPNTDWGNPEALNGVQTSINEMLSRYDQCKQTCTASSSKFIAIPQTFAYWNGHTGDPYYNNSMAENSWFCYEMPTANMLKCLKYLPLCYGVDGISDFTLSSAGAMFVCPTDYTWLHPANDAYPPIQAANDKIKIYGPILLGADWQGAQCIKIDDQMQTSPIMDISLVNDNISGSNEYHSYVQCALYQKNQERYFYLVNRRTDYLRQGESPSTTHYHNYSSIFQSPTDSYLRFSWDGNTSFENVYGSRVGLLDPYSHNLQTINIVNHTGYTDISIAPGEATLRQIVSVLPAVVTSNFTASSDVYVVDSSASISNSTVTIPISKTLYVRDNCRLKIENGSQLIINGNLDIGNTSVIIVRNGSTLTISEALYANNSSRIIVDNYSHLVIQGIYTAGINSDLSAERNSDITFISANCTMAEGTAIHTSDSGVILGNSNFIGLSGVTWNGFNCTNGFLSVHNVGVENAINAFTVSNSNMSIFGSIIRVPAHGIGIQILNSLGSNIINLDSENGIYNSIAGSSGLIDDQKGIVMHSSSNPFYCCHTRFENLGVGIEYSLTASKTDSISTCVFNDCINGVNVTGGAGLAKISNCQFNFGNQISSLFCFGIKLQTYNPFINSCSFWTNTLHDKLTGIFLDATQSVKEIPISNCTFENLGYGVQGRESQVTCIGNVFTNNIRGIAIGAKSLFCLNNDARNEFRSIYSNLWFWDSQYSPASFEKFTASVFLRAGHNDFYNFANCCDFRFDANHYDFEHSSKIDASGNFWGYPSDDNNLPTVNPIQNANLIISDYSDRAPNIPDPNITENRLDIAAGFEKIEAYTSAYLLYQQILHERLLEEKDYWDVCVPKIFSLAKGNQFDFDALLSYYDFEIAQTDPTDKIELIWLMNGYKAFTCLAKKDYQGAADIISERILNPISEIDSLNAVIDLEIVYFQRDLDGSKKPLNTNFTQYHYPNLQIFNAKHVENLMKLQTLYDRQDGTPYSIPTTVILNQNYPNPFNPSTTIEFGVPIAENVSIKIFNIKGQEVKKVVDQNYQPGKFKVVWEGNNNAGKPVSAGVYFYRIEAGGKSITHKMLLLK